jgi:hypothetical protein
MLYWLLAKAIVDLQVVHAATGNLRGTCAESGGFWAPDAGRLLALFATSAARMCKQILGPCTL